MVVHKRTRRGSRGGERGKGRGYPPIKCSSLSEKLTGGGPSNNTQDARVRGVWSFTKGGAAMNAEKLKRINTEKNKLKRQFTKLDAKTKKIVESLVSNAAFMIVTLEELQQQINEKGAVSEYKNGENQYGTKKSPEVEIYNTMIKNHMSIIKQLTDLLQKDSVPPPTGGEKDDGFEAFVNRR